MNHRSAQQEQMLRQASALLSVRAQLRAWPAG
jgi:hypothetical protein